MPKPCDVALIALSAANVAPAIEQCGKAGIPFALVLAGGFSEIGAEGKALQENLIETARKANVRMVGPNCLGMINLKDNARIGFGGTAQLKTLKPGPMAMVTQSGGFGFGVVAIAAHFKVGCNYAISTGNEADLTLLDWVADLLERDDVEVVVAFMEAISDGRRLVDIGERALELGKPVLVWKVGNTDVGSKAATSHSARLTAGYELYRDRLPRGGLVEIRDVDDLVDIAKAFHTRKLPAGNGVGVLTLSGGAGVLLADRCIESGLRLPDFAAATTTRAARRRWSRMRSSANPVDATANGYNDAFASYGKAVELVLNDPNIDQLDRPDAPRQVARASGPKTCCELLRGSSKPCIVDWPTSPDDNGDVIEYLEENGVPCIVGSGRAARALAALTEFSDKCRAYRERAGKTLQRAVAPPGARSARGRGDARRASLEAAAAAVRRARRGRKAVASRRRSRRAGAPLSVPGRGQDRVPGRSAQDRSRRRQARHRRSRGSQAGGARNRRRREAPQARRAHRRRAGAGDGERRGGHRGRGERPRASAPSSRSGSAAYSPS